MLDEKLPALCKIVYQRLGISLPADADNIYSTTALRAKGFLRIAAALAAGGGDGLVSILCLPHRQDTDWGWLGSPTERHLQLIGTSRASKRLHILVEDLRPEVVIPTGGSTIVHEGKMLGLKTSADHVFSSTCSQVEIRKWEEQSHGQML